MTTIRSFVALALAVPVSVSVSAVDGDGGLIAVKTPYAAKDTSTG